MRFARSGKHFLSLKVPALGWSAFVAAAVLLTSLFATGTRLFGFRPSVLFQASSTLLKPSGQAYVPSLLPWEPLLSAAQVRRGLSHYGSGRDIERVAAKLLAGQPIMAVVLGGSVSHGGGASNNSKGYPALFFHHLNTSFPHRDHVFLNRAVGGSSSGVFSACAESLVPYSTDMIIVELTVNDWMDVPFTDLNRQTFEQLLRKLLRLPRSPAVIVLHHYAWHLASEDSVPAGLFYRSAEVQLSVLAQYYDLPSLSVRNSVYDAMRAGLAPFKVDHVLRPDRTTVGVQRVPLPVASNETRHQFFFIFDEIHPSDIGHQALAEVLAGLLQQALGHAAAVTAQRSQVTAAKAADAPAFVPDAYTSAHQLRPAMIPNNADHPTSVCAIQEGFKSVVSATQGFIYKAERPDAPTFTGQKWGFVSEQPGDWLELLVNTEASPGSHGDALVHLGFLRSYEHMGLAVAHCKSGCECADTQLDAAWDRRTSQTFTSSFQVTQHPQCLLRITIIERPEPAAGKGNKFQVSAIIVAHVHWNLDIKTSEVEA